MDKDERLRAENVKKLTELTKATNDLTRVVKELTKVLVEVGRLMQSTQNELKVEGETDGTDLERA